MEQDEIRNAVASFDTWRYEFDLDGVKTPVANPQLVIRDRERKKYFIDPIVEGFGGSLAGKRVLDLGCNAGFWSLQALEAGADYVLGIDGRETHIDQANLVFSAKNIDRSRYSFHLGNVLEFDLESEGKFDIVFCLGLLYHLVKPFELLEKIAAVNDDILLIDTVISARPGSMIELRHDRMKSLWSAVDYELVIAPTRAAVMEMSGQLGYSTVVLKPKFSSYRKSAAYLLGERRAFLCGKESDVKRWNLETERLGFRRGPQYNLARRFLRRGLLKILDSRS